MGQTYDTHVMSNQYMSKVVGVLGIILPWACWATNALVNWLDLLNNSNLVTLGPISNYSPESNLKASISHFYYTASAPLFIGIVVTVAVFLFSYKGSKKKPTGKLKWITDDLVTTWAAIFAFGLVIFPTGADEFIPDNLFVFTTTKLVGLFHNLFAGSFFILMAVLCLVNFRRKENQESTGDKYDLLYRICGWLILSSIASVLVFRLLVTDYLNFGLPVIFILETIALAAFGTAWLVKGEIDKAINLRLIKLNSSTS